MDSSLSPDGYSYRLVVWPSDYRKCYDAQRKAGQKPYENIGSPAVMALNSDGQVMGFAGTIPRKGELSGVKVPILGNLFLSEGAGLSRMLNIFEAYDKVMLLSGVHEYAFFTLPEDVKWKETLVKIGKRCGEGMQCVYDGGTSEHSWFRRKLLMPGEAT